MMDRRSFATAILTLSLAIPAAAQQAKSGTQSPKANEFPFSFGPIGLGVLQKEAGVSDEQMQRFHEIFQFVRVQLVDLRGEVEKREGDLQQLLNGAHVDTAQAERAVDAVLDARNRLAKVQTMMMVRMRQIVTQEQWLKIAELQRQTNPPPPPKPVPVPEF
jgi:Spy/CpxP family protein refolding chaperone